MRLRVPHLSRPRSEAGAVVDADAGADLGVEEDAEMMQAPKSMNHPTLLAAMRAVVITASSPHCRNVLDLETALMHGLSSVGVLLRASPRRACNYAHRSQTLTLCSLVPCRFGRSRAAPPRRPP